MREASLYNSSSVGQNVPKFRLNQGQECTCGDLPVKAYNSKMEVNI